MNDSKISIQDVKHLAQLSSISLTDDAATEALRENLEDILRYVEQLSELDTTGVEPTYQVTGLQNVWRKDVVSKQHVTRERLLKLAPEQANNQVKVPRVL
ncbi:MAG: Asp-tRNA(Asn)/Glu-tRNA(Gln) amidotransferase subunit GatC [Candidatus Saccharimonas sp.]